MNIRPLKKSQELRRRAESAIAGGALTNSKRPQSFVQGVYPTHISHGLGAQVWDVDGNRYVDYICGLGSILFGHRNRAIDSAVVQQIHKGTVFSLGTELEVEVAELFQNQFHYMELVRFLKTGTEACSAAVRIARSFTKRSTVLSDAYHGWSDEFVSLTPPADGVPPHGHIKKLDPNLIDDSVAAVIVEPVVTIWDGARVRWLQDLRDRCTKAGALLIFDECITGIRFPSLSVGKAAGVTPDLTIFGKVVGGGLPLSVVGGGADVMSAPYFVSSTFAGDCLALAAAKAVFDLIKQPDLIASLQRSAQSFCSSFNAIEPNLITIEGYSTRGVFKGGDLTKALFFQECVKAGILFGPSFLYGTTHSTHDDETLSVCRAVLNRIKNNEVKLEGPMPSTPFAQKVRE